MKKAKTVQLLRVLPTEGQDRDSRRYRALVARRRRMSRRRQG